MCIFTKIKHIVEINIPQKKLINLKINTTIETNLLFAKIRISNKTKFIKNINNS
jgi:hypothetical protein